MINNDTLKAYLESMGAEIKIVQSTEEIERDLLDFYNELNKIVQDYNINIFATNGEANCRIWNKTLYNAMKRVLETGKVKAMHSLGPIVSFDTFNAIVQCYKDFPSALELYMTNTRYPYHWILAEFDNGKKFRLRGEFYHQALGETREKYTINLLNENDPYAEEKISFKWIQLQSFNSLKNRSTHIKKFSQLEQYLLSNDNIKRCEEIAQMNSLFFDAINFSGIKNLISNLE